MINFILSLNIDGILKQFENCGQFSTNSVGSLKCFCTFRFSENIYAHLSGTSHFKNCKQLFENQHLLLLESSGGQSCNL